MTHCHRGARVPGVLSRNIDIEFDITIRSSDGATEPAPVRQPMPPTNQARHRAAIPNAGKRRTSADGPGRELRGTGRTSRGRLTRTRLIDAARLVFERDGFLHARIADMCAEAGVAQSSFYTYFLSKEEIFDEVVNTVELDMLTMPSGDDTRSPVERIRDANRHYLEFYRDNAGILAVIDQMATFDDGISAARSERHDRFARAIEHRIREYQDSGLADPRVNAYFGANALGGMVTAMATHMFVRRAGDDLDLAVEQLTVLWANAIGLDAN
jgi:AcrR family transcriptional regulator